MPSAPARPTKTKGYRFDARLNRRQKTLIQRAADLEGRSMTDFVLHSAEIAAERTIRERTMLVLSAEDSRIFVDAILNPPEPNAVLKAAVRDYKKYFKSDHPKRALRAGR